MTEAESRIGKRYRMLNDTHGVAQGTTGTVIIAMRLGMVGIGMATGIGGKVPAPTDAVWMLDIKCDDTSKSVISVDERDESIEEIGGQPLRTPAERLGCEDDDEAA